MDVKDISIDWKSVEEEAVEVLRDLIKIDTTNPPGSEREAAEYMKKYFEKYEIKAEIVGPSDERASVMCQYGEKPGIIFLSHLDVVPAQKSEWSKDPFGGEVSNGYVWGRGALDCKGLAVCEAIVITLLKRMKINLKKGVKFISVADEEMGGEFGAKYVVENEDIEGEVVINEGGSGVILGKRKVFMPCFGEKGPLWIKITARGKPGHGSMPHSENPNDILISALQKIYSSPIFQFELPQYIVKSASEYIETKIQPILKIVEKFLSIKEARKILGNLLSIPLRKNYKILAMIRNTVSLTMLNSGYKENVIPEKASAVLDIRILPGYTIEDVLEALKKTVSDERISFEVLSMYNPSLTSPQHQFLKFLKETLREIEPSTPFFPIVATGFTDSRYFREKGTPSFGFLPFFLTEEEISTIHGIDERIRIDELRRGIEVLLKIVLKYQNY